MHMFDVSSILLDGVRAHFQCISVRKRDSFLYPCNPAAPLLPTTASPFRFQSVNRRDDEAASHLAHTGIDRVRRIIFCVLHISGAYPNVPSAPSLRCIHGSRRCRRWAGSPQSRRHAPGAEQPRREYWCRACCPYGGPGPYHGHHLVLLGL